MTRSTASGDITSAASGTAYRFFSIELQGAGGFQIPPERFLRDPALQRTHWTAFGGAAYDTTNPRSTNELFSVESTTWDLYPTLVTSTFIDLRSKHSV